MSTDNHLGFEQVFRGAMFVWFKPRIMVKTSLQSILFGSEWHGTTAKYTGLQVTVCNIAAI